MAYIIEKTTWKDMINRCTNPRLSNYKNYGGRGIKVCDRWLESFDNFLEDMGPRPAALKAREYSLDRIDVNGDYEPANCRWASNAEQSMNRRPYGKVKYIGVYLNKNSGSYIAQLGIEPNKNLNIKACKTPEKAAEIRDLAVLSWRGLGVKLNFPDKLKEYRKVLRI